MKPTQGTYVLILHCKAIADIEIGRWGCLHIKPMYYIYIGSAFGPGGIKARVGRHFRKNKSKHWHIDYLLEYVKPLFALVNYGSVKLEHRWAGIFNQMKNIYPVKGFGCSDCSCNSHLFITNKNPDITGYTKALDEVIELYSFVVSEDKTVKN